MKKQFIKIQNLRYRVSSIKRYEPFHRGDNRSTPFGIYVYFSMTGNSSRVYPMFEDESERDTVLMSLDQAFGV